MGKLPFEEVQRDIILKKESITDPSMGQNPNTRPVDQLIQYGVITLDKPKGPTSHQVSDYVQRLLGITKAGHGGTLDPGVTGILPIALGNATRIVQALLPAGKEYVCLMHLHKDVEDKKLKKVFEQFTGAIMQLPPIKSAVKRVERERTIYYLELLEREEKEVLFRVGCQAGTYIRKLCTDMGRALGCGAHMAELRRTKAACFTEATLVTLQDIADAMYYLKEGNEAHIRKVIHPIEFAVQHLPKLWVHDSAVQGLCHGRDLALPGISKLHNDLNPGDKVAVLTLKEELIGIGEATLTSIGMSGSGKGIAVKMEKIFMAPSVYKRI